MLNIVELDEVEGLGWCQTALIRCCSDCWCALFLHFIVDLEKIWYFFALAIINCDKNELDPHSEVCWQIIEDLLDKSSRSTYLIPTQIRIPPANTDIRPLSTTGGQFPSTVGGKDNILKIMNKLLIIQGLGDAFPIDQVVRFSVAICAIKFWRSRTSQAAIVTSPASTIVVVVLMAASFAGIVLPNQEGSAWGALICGASGTCFAASLAVSVANQETIEAVLGSTPL